MKGYGNQMMMPMMWPQQGMMKGEQGPRPEGMWGKSCKPWNSADIRELQMDANGKSIPMTEENAAFVLLGVDSEMKALHEMVKSGIVWPSWQMGDGNRFRLARRCGALQQVNQKMTDEQFSGLMAAIKAYHISIGMPMENHILKHLAEIKKDQEQKMRAKGMSQFQMYTDDDAGKTWQEDQWRYDNWWESYYETMDGVKCDRALVDSCREAVKGQGDGRVSKADAETVFAKASDGVSITRVERWTLRYCLTEFKWTDAALTYVEEQMKLAPPADDDDAGDAADDDDKPDEPDSKRARKDYYQKVDGMKLDGKMIDVCKEAIKGRGDGRLSVDDATKVVASAADGGKITRCERWTMRYCLTEFNWTEAALDHFHEEIQKIGVGDDN